MKKFLPFSKLLSWRILVVTFFTTIIVALCVVVVVTKRVVNMTNAYFRSQVMACNESVSKLIGHADQDSIYQYVSRIDQETNRIILAEDVDEKDPRKWWSYSLVIDSAGTYLYHPDRQRIGKGNIFDDNGQRQSWTFPMTTDYVGQDTITLNGKPYYGFFARRANASWANAIIVPAWDLIMSTFVTGLIILAIIVLGLLITYWISRITIYRSTKPLQLLAKSADEVAKGNFQSPLPEVKRNNEIGQLRDSFSNMQHSLTEYIDQLKTTTAQKAAIESELTIARDIQLSLVPSMPPAFLEEPGGKAGQGSDRGMNGRIDIWASMTPAKAVGGDLYDFFITPADTSPSSEKLYFCIGDVSGKGVPAALFMTQAMSLFRAYSKDEAMPDRIVSKMNHDLSMNNENCMFVTLFVGILDLTSGVLSYCNAGHEPPIVVRSIQPPSGSPCSGEEVTLLPMEPGLPVGLNPDMTYQTQTVALEPQTTVFFYTDGLNEAMDADFNEFGGDRILDVVNRAVQAGQVAPKALIERMTQAVHDFVGDTEQSDDLTMLAIQYQKQTT